METLFCSKSVHITNLIEAFKALQLALQTFKTNLVETDKTLPCWFEPPEKLNIQGTSREKIASFVLQLEYLDTQDPREILIGPGLVCASQKTLEAIQVLNHAKLGFKQVILALKPKNLTLPQWLKRDPETSEILTHLGFARLHLKQCYRTLPFFEQTPSKVSWTWANTKAITKITQKQAKEKLEKINYNQSLNWQIARLGVLKPEEPLAIIQQLSPHLRTNMVFKNDEEIERKMLKGTVPIFYLNDNLPFPEMTPPKNKAATDPKRIVRNDTKLEKIPFLPAIRAHRYLD